MAAAAATPPAANMNICALFQLQESIDKVAFTRIFNLLDNEGDRTTTRSAIPNNVVAAVLVSILKVLVCHSPLIVRSSTTENGLVEWPHRDGLYGLVLNFVRFQSQLTLDDIGASSTAAAPPCRFTLDQVLEHCSYLLRLDRYKEPTPTSATMIRCFWEYHSAKSDPAKELSNSSIGVDTESLRSLFFYTFYHMRSNIVRCLEDFSDFEYIWSSTLNDTVADTPFFSSESVSPISREPRRSWEQRETSLGLQSVLADSNQIKSYCRDDHNRKRMRSASIGSNDDMIPSSESLRQVAKELSWTFLQSAKPAPNSRIQTRKDRILNAAASIDLVVAAFMAPIISAPIIGKRRRVECEGNDPRPSAGAESAAALSNILSTRLIDAHDGSFGTRLRGQMKRSMLQATSELMLSLTDNTSPVHHKDVIERAQKIASSALEVLNKNYGSSPTNASPANQLLSYISSHKLRQHNLNILGRKFQRIMAEQVHASINAYFPYSCHEEMASKLGSISIDVMHDLFHLCLSERKLLAQFESNPSSSQAQMEDLYKVKALIFGNPSARPTFRHALHIRGGRNPPTTEAERNDLNEWTSTIFDFVSTTSKIKPSPWLMEQFASACDFRCNGSNDESDKLGVWDGLILPVLNYFMRVWARCPDASQISDEEYIVRNDDTTPGAVLQLYYFALESIIRAKPSMVHKPRFHSSLFSLCYYCLQLAKNPGTQIFVIEDIGECPAEFYKLLGLFIGGLESNGGSVEMNRALAMPSYVKQDLRRLQEMILSMVWMKSNNNFESSFLGIVIRLRKNPAAWRLTCPIDDCEGNGTKEHSREQTVVNFLLRNLVDVIKHRVSTLCHLLELHLPYMAVKTLEIFKRVLCDRTELFFDRHPDQIMLCCMYATVGNHVTFQKIADAYTEMNRDVHGLEISYTILHRIKNCGHDNQYGDIITLYNDVFLPSVKRLRRYFRRE